MPERIKRLDQHRHELKALRYLLEHHPDSMSGDGELPAREDFQIEESRLIFDALVHAATQTEAIRVIEALELDETEVESFLRLGGQFYHGYPAMVKARGRDFRDGKLEVVDPNA